MSNGTIIYIGGFELPDKNAAAHRVLSNGKVFRELGYNLVFIDVDKSLSFESDILDTKKNVQDFDCWSLPYPKSNKQWVKFLTDIESIKLISSKYDEVKAIVAYNYPAIALYKLRSYCRKNNIRIIADCTEWYSTRGSSVAFKIIKGLDSFLRMRIIQKRLDGLIVISKFLESYYKDHINTIRIPPLVDLDEKKWESNNSKTRDTNLRMVYSGSPGKNKDKINYIIEALYELDKYSNYVFNIVGITKEQYINYYPEHKTKLSALEERIVFLGRISHFDSLNALKNSDFSIFIREKSRLTMAGFPTKFVESISCGIPVITTDTSDIGEYFSDEKNGFFLDANSLGKMKEVFINLLDDDQAIAEVKDRKFNKKVFHYENYVDKVSIFVQSTLN